MAKSKTRKPRSKAAEYKKWALGQMLYENQLGMHYNGGRQEGYMIAVIIIFWVMHEKYGFGKKRLALMMRVINDFCQDYVAVGPDGTRRCETDGIDGISLQDMVDKITEQLALASEGKISPEDLKMDPFNMA